MIFKIAPVIIPIADIAALPCKRIWLFMANTPDINGVPKRIYIKYSLAYGIMVGVDPKMYKTGSINIPHKIAIILDVIRAEKNPVAPIVAASSVFCAPNAREIKLPEP